MQRRRHNGMGMRFVPLCAYFPIGIGPSGGKREMGTAIERRGAAVGWNLFTDACGSIYFGAMALANTLPRRT